MGKRGNNEGSIRKRTDGTWEARYVIGHNDDGKLNRKSVYGKTRKEVSEKLAEALQKINTGSYIEDTNITFYDWIFDWMITYKKQSVKAATFQITETLIRNHIKGSKIGKSPLKDIKPIDIQKFYNSKLGVISPATIKRMHVIIKESLDKACENKLLSTNPATKINLPKVDKKEVEIMTKEQQKQFLERIENHKYRPIFILALQTGLRIGELLALKWSDYDEKNKELNIKRTIGRKRTNYDENSTENKTSLLVTEPKTASSKRKVPLMKTAIIELKKHKESQDSFANEYKDVYTNKENWIFTSLVGSSIEARKLTKHFTEILLAAKLPHFNFHCLRHTFVSRMIEAGADIKSISTIIGHTSVSFTLDVYGHILPQQKQITINKINGLFETKKKKPKK